MRRFFVTLCLAFPMLAASGGDALGLLEAHCARCHGGEKTKGGLDLTTREGLLKGGETGPAIALGNLQASLLLRSIRHEGELRMPYQEEKLEDAAIKTLVAWVRDGAVYSRRLDAAKRAAVPESGRVRPVEKHWAFQPVARPDPPRAGKHGNAIDGFIGAKLKEAGLGFAPPASRAALLRRVTFDLIGLPPTMAEMDEFARDRRADAYERVLDRLLASPRYGERWGRHWLDLARFAESDGFEHDAVRPHSWRYRDYVVRSFNSDKPYDRFIREQLAGDEVEPGNPEAVTATAFNLLGPDMVDSSDQAQRRHNTLNDMTDTASLAFLGLTVGCARCHDHKFEPLSQKDYYGLQAFFTPAKFVPAQAIPNGMERRAHDVARRIYQEQPAVRELAELEAGPRAAIRARKVAALSPEAQEAHRTPASERNAEQANLVLETEEKAAVTEQDLAAELGSLEKKRRKELQDEIKKLPKPEAPPMTMALAGQGVPAKARVLARGDYSQPGELVDAAIPVALRRGPEAPSTVDGPRAALANWIASPGNPLTARVIVNRIWQHHFGRGLVGSPSNFGVQGQPPTHPELLDWLATEFVARGWSIKAMHRLMLTSQAYRQSSRAASQAGAEIDPENKLLWRMNRLRLEGEPIRDSLLAIGGNLRMEMGGPGVFPPLPKELFEGAAGWPAASPAAKHDRRSIYIFARRNLRYPFLEVFDLPDNNLSCPSRERSATAPQSLTLLNSDEVLRAARGLATALEALPVEGRIEAAYRRVLNRRPGREEVAIARGFLAKWPLEEFCRALFNLNDFIYLE